VNKAIFVLGFTTLACGATSLYFRDQARSERERVDMLQTRVHELEKVRAAPIPATTPVIADAEPMPAPAVLPAPEPRPAPASARPTATFSAVSTGMMGFRFDRSRKLLEDPEYREAMRAQQRVMLLERYPDLAAALHLQSDQQERLLDLLADQQIRAMSNAPPFRPDGAPLDENAAREFQERMLKQQRDNEAELAALLGSNAMQQWSEYQNSLGARMQVRQLRSTLEAAGEPLRDDQVQSLVTAMTAETQRRNAEFASNTQTAAVTRTIDTTDRMATFEQMLQRTEQYNKRVHDAVAPYLSTQQLASFDAAQDRQLLMQRANLKMMRAQSAAEAREGVPANAAFSAGATMVAEPPR
jgi:hypothetical protein